MKRRHGLTAVCGVVVLGAAAVGAHAQEAGDAGAEADVFDSALRLGGEEVRPGAMEVQLWVKQPMDVERVVRIGSQVLVKERGTGRVWAGWMPTPGQAELGDWTTPEQLLSQMAYPPLPQAPEGFTVTEAHRPSDQGVRVIGEASGRWLYVLGVTGAIDRVDTTEQKAGRWIDDTAYITGPGGERFVQGLCFDRKQRLYVVVNVKDESVTPVTNRVTIYRSGPVEHGSDAVPTLTPWLRTSYPWGVNAFNHGVGDIACGPDGMLYVGSGSRTDHGEDSDDPRYADGGETEITACLWRLDPEAGPGEPKIEVHARGLRNAFGFNWDAEGRMWATENGPNADAPEELNLIEAGGHYGYPHVFADLPVNPYPDAPPGLVFTPPVINLGPDAGGSAESPLGTFDAHSSPSGVVYLGDAFPAEMRGKLLIARFGNQLGTGHVGYDLLLGEVRDAAVDGRVRATFTTWMTGIARPLGLWATADGRIYVLEHSRQAPGTQGWGAAGMPGRLLEIRRGE